MKQQIIDLIAKRNVTFVELERDIPGFKGGYPMFLGAQGKNIYLWDDVSTEAVGILNELIQSDTIIMRKCNPFLYAIDGQYLDFPIAKDVDYAYKTPRWLPVSFYPGAPKCK